MTIYICGIPHTVVEKEDNFDSETHFGMIDYGKCEIVINKNIPEQLKKETITHEVIHGILLHIGRQDLSGDEQFVQALGNAIFQTFDVKKVGEVQTVTFENGMTFNVNPNGNIVNC